jgi:hypothetical protein
MGNIRAIPESVVEGDRRGTGKNDEDYEGFDASLGANFVNGYSYYNQKAAFAVENWQILSPVRKHSHGVSSINRLIHQRYRSKMVEFAQRERHRLVPKPMGSEQIVYGDKVIKNTNHYRFILRKELLSILPMGKLEW